MKAILLPFVVGLALAVVTGAALAGTRQTLVVR